MPLTPTTRASLLLRLCDSDDHEAWVEFVTLYEPAIYRSFRRHGLQDADARDVMQELLLAISGSIDRWDPRRQRGSFRGWLRRVARNLVIDWLRQPARRAVPAGAELESLLDALPAAGADSVEFDREVRRAVFNRAGQRVRGEVQQATWEAFWQTAVLGKPAADVAAGLGMTVGAVHVARCRVLARVRAAIAEMENEE
jgi:RNA polymerase sigma factor (sigma-70 family)